MTRCTRRRGWPGKLKPVHPGEILREEFMKPLGLSMNKLALDLRVPCATSDASALTLISRPSPFWCCPTLTSSVSLQARSRT
jgi:hypothetical protein